MCPKCHKEVKNIFFKYINQFLKMTPHPFPESGMNWNSTTTKPPYGRTRGGQGPTPAASTESLNHSDTLPRALQRTRKMAAQDCSAPGPPTPDRTRRQSKMAATATSPKSPAKAKTSLKSPGGTSNNLSAAPSGREGLNSEYGDLGCLWV